MAALVAAVVLFTGPTAGSAAAGSFAGRGPEQGSTVAAARGAGAAKPPVFTTGGFGPVKLRMTVKAAMGTGWVKENRSDEMCAPAYVLIKPYRRHVSVAFGPRLRAISTWTGRYQTSRGVGVGSRYRALKNAYGKRLTKPQRDEPGYAWVRVKGNRTWLNFLFHAPGGVTNRSKVTHLTLSTQKASGLGGC